MRISGIRKALVIVRRPVPFRLAPIRLAPKR